MPENRAHTPRNEPPRRRGLQTIGCILEAAAQVLENVGFKWMGTTEVARCAGPLVGSRIEGGGQGPFHR
jgi:hypothetical protein